MAGYLNYKVGVT